MDFLSHLRTTNINTPVGHTTIILAAYISTMTKPLIHGSAPLRAWKNLVRLVLTSGYPLQTLVASPSHKIQLRTLDGRRRSYSCFVKEARVQKSVSSRRSTPPRSSPGSGRRSRSSSGASSKGSPKSQGPVRSGRITKWPITSREMPVPIDKNYEPVGLSNPRAYCYRLSLLQCLVHLPALYNEIVQQNLHAECDISNEACIACAFKEFLFQYWNSCEKANFPRGRKGDALHTLHKAANACDPRNTFHEFANDWEHGDPWTFFTYLFDQIKETDEELFRAIERLFQITHEITRTCPNCDKKVVSAESNMGLSLSMRELPKGEELALLDYLREHHADPVDGVQCTSEACIAASSQSDRDSQLGINSPEPENPPHPRVFKITEAPQVFTINLKRGQYNKVLQDTFKVEDFVDLPEDLELTEFNQSGKALKYRLYGVVAHHGERVERGHWIAAVRHRDGTQYRTINDSGVDPPNEVGFENLRNPWSHHDYFSPTVLLYLKVEDGNEA